MNIAIVGSGISGLTAARLLSRKHDVTVFEAGHYIGGHTNTIDVEVAGKSYAIDTGFIVFNESNYPNFCQLMDMLGVASQPTTMSFSVRSDATGVEYNGSSLGAMFTRKLNLLRWQYWRMIAEIVRFSKQAKRVLVEDDDRLSVADYVARERFSEMFLRHYLVPLGASLWSCPAEQFRAFPIRFVIEFLDNHAMLEVGNQRPQWRVIQGGSRGYIKPLIAPFEHRIRLNCPVHHIQRDSDSVAIHTKEYGHERFDHVVIACHSDTALKILGDATPNEREILGAFPYQANEAILHTDTSVLPKKRSAWASWNYRIGEQSDAIATVTYHMNQLQGIESDTQFCVTLNDDADIDPARIHRRIQYHHPIYTSARTDAQSRHHQMANHNQTSFCGAYWGYGFHEDGVTSALAVCKTFGEELSP